jgi:hypothetical protein
MSDKTKFIILLTLLLLSVGLALAMNSAYSHVLLGVGR